ncbi:protein kinase activator [Colletotrichum chrysophilum]|uniref:Protein kinase activator n=1 Tax=Colletotrichum chrysophilum TaxID=1836956 RepID=A0AAD9EMC7_9PEZI|nr:protein kinase activator [Colletotrichum chrysophilum]
MRSSKMSRESIARNRFSDHLLTVPHLLQALRRSIKGEKDNAKISIAPKSAVAIVPPKKVIRALYDYEAQSNQELSFSRGDFFHVIGRENDPDWYEACNPALPDARGLVPVAFFQALGRTERDSGQSDGGGLPRPPTMSPTISKNPDHDSGYAEAAPPPGAMQSPPAMQRMSRSAGKGSGAMVYGIVMYDFVAERADELEAKAGEAIIVIAQSNPEWFVAKPIGRLGGPGLIPVSFVEIRDMATDSAVGNASDAIKKAGIPKVEEWKKMAADYKNSSITLGKFDVGGAPQQGSLEQGMERMSIQQGQRRGSQQTGNSFVSQTHLILICIKLTCRAAAATTGELPTITNFPTGGIAADYPLHQIRRPAVCPDLSPHPQILLCRGQVLVCHRGCAGGWPSLGALSILRGLLRLPNRAPHRVSRRGRQHRNAKAHLAVHAGARQLRY